MENQKKISIKDQSFSYDASFVSCHLIHLFKFDAEKKNQMHKTDKYGIINTTNLICFVCTGKIRHFYFDGIFITRPIQFSLISLATIIPLFFPVFYRCELKLSNVYYFLNAVNKLLHSCFWFKLSLFPYFVCLFHFTDLFICIIYLRFMHIT